MSNNASSLVAESVTPPGAGTPNTVSPIAIVGVGCRFAGGVDSPEALWDLLESGGNAVREVPPERWDVAEVYDPQPGIPGKTVSRWGGFWTRSADSTRPDLVSPNTRPKPWTHSIGFWSRCPGKH